MPRPSFPHAGILAGMASLALLFAPLALRCEPAAATLEDSTATAGHNRLADEPSPYLRQHADNPVDWYPWGEAAFAAAREQDKPILLSIGYSTCYWCHVMERESFADPETAALMNEHVVSVKVDREVRPGVDRLYLTAMELMQGYSGWPATLLLTHDLKPFYAGGYLPRDELRELLRSAAQQWEHHRERLQRQAGVVAEEVRRATSLAAAGSAAFPGPDVLVRAVEHYRETFDPFDGGFGPAPKFPDAPVLAMLLAYHERSEDPESLEMVTTTLEAMARGGIHDQIGGGFHRYAIDNQWHIPHFEKMLYDNAQLLHLYARAWALTDNPVFRRAAAGIVAYIDRVMTADDGLFLAAQDAAVDHAEGRTYLWSRDEVRALLSDTEYALAARVYGLTGPPDFEGEHVLHWPRDYAAVAAERNTSVEGLLKNLEPIRATLLAARNQRPQPARDHKRITAWNALMIEALARAGMLLEREDYVRRAGRAAGALLAILRDPSTGLRHVAYPEHTGGPAYLADYAAAILALIAVHEATGETSWLDQAAALAQEMSARLRDPGGGFFDTPASAEHLFTRVQAVRDDALPAGNSLAALALTRLAQAKGPAYTRLAGATLQAFAGLLRSQPEDLPYMLIALNEFHGTGLAEAYAGTPDQGHQSTRDVVSLTLRQTTGAGKDAAADHDLEVRLEIASGWHINGHATPLDFLIPTRIDITHGQRRLAFAAQYPPGEKLDVDLAEEPIPVYSATVRIPVTIPADAWPRDGGTLTLKVRTQACSDDGVCLAPATLTRRFSAAGRGRSD